MIQVQQLKLPVGHKDTALLEALIAKLHVKKDDILSFEVAKRSLDARKKPELFYSYVVNVQVKNQAAVLKKKPKNTILFEKKIYQLPTPLKEAPSLRPVIIGTATGIRRHARVFSIHFHPPGRLRPPLDLAGTHPFIRLICER